MNRQHLDINSSNIDWLSAEENEVELCLSNPGCLSIETKGLYQKGDLSKLQKDQKYLYWDEN